ncbi:hypothetical protein Tco_1384486 [Tanacetum coccineum]
MPTEMELTLEQTQQGVSYEVSNIRVNSFTMKMEILLEPTSNKLMVEHAEYDESNTYVLERFNTSAGNPVKKILLKLNLSDHRLCKMVVEVPDSSWLTRSITTCSYPTDKHKVIMKAQYSTLASVEKGPLVWPSITEDGVTRLKEYVELTPAEAIQADCDIKAINIILQGLPTEIYALMSQHRVAKDLWEKIKLLMQGTSLTKQERECKLYDEFRP